jgi:hypothetical protein
MITPRLTNGSEHIEIIDLLNDIDCKIATLAKDFYNNIIFALNRPMSRNTMRDLLHYKRILIYKSCNRHYASHYTVKMIASKVKLLKFR